MLVRKKRRLPDWTHDFYMKNPDGSRGRRVTHVGLVDMRIGQTDGQGTVALYDRWRRRVSTDDAPRVVRVALSDGKWSTTLSDEQGDRSHDVTTHDLDVTQPEGVFTERRSPGAAFAAGLDALRSHPIAIGDGHFVPISGRLTKESGV